MKANSKAIYISKHSQIQQKRQQYQIKQENVQINVNFPGLKGQPDININSIRKITKLNQIFLQKFFIHSALLHQYSSYKITIKPKICYNFLQSKCCLYYTAVITFSEEKHATKTKGFCRLDYHIHRIMPTKFSYFCFRIYCFKVTGGRRNIFRLWVSFATGTPRKQIYHII